MCQIPLEVFDKFNQPFRMLQVFLGGVIMKQYGEKFIDEFSKAELEKLAKQGQLIDVRTEEEYALEDLINGSYFILLMGIESFNKEK